MLHEDALAGWLAGCKRRVQAGKRCSYTVHSLILQSCSSFFFWKETNNLDKLRLRWAQCTERGRKKKGKRRICRGSEEGRNMYVLGDINQSITICLSFPGFVSRKICFAPMRRFEGMVRMSSSCAVAIPLPCHAMPCPFPILESCS